ncbi:MAG: HAD hydrolase-like protein [Gemmatimonadales bacterium]
MTLCVVFDFDGVLVDSNAVKRQAYFGIFAPLGPDTSPVVAHVLAGDTDSDRFQLIRAIITMLRDTGVFVGSGSADELVARFAERYNAICEQHAATCAEIAGASAAIGRLARAHPQYVVSATPEAPLRRIVERRGWTSSFRDVLGRPRTKIENLRLVIAREGIGGADLVVVGDGRRDLDAAREAGARFIGVRNAFNDFDPASLLMLDDLRTLPDVIESAGTPAPLAPGA